MADLQIGNPVGVAAKGGKNINGGNADDTGMILTNATGRTISSLKARLTAISSTTCTASRLSTMSYNDMVYAVRLADQLTTI